jgi:hypothetical protein
MAVASATRAVAADCSWPSTEGGEGGGVGSGDREPAGDLAEIPGDLEPTGGNPDVVLSTSSVGGERETPRVSLGEPTAAMEASAAEKGMAVGGRPCTPPKPLLTTRPRRIPSEVRWRHSARTRRPAPAAALDTPVSLRARAISR